MPNVRTYPAPGTAEAQEKSAALTRLRDALDQEIRAIAQADEYDVPMSFSDDDLSTLKAAYNVLDRLATDLTTA